MSFILTAQALKIKVGNPARKLVLMKLADQANDDGMCYPSYATIKEDCEISMRSAKEHIKWLEEYGFIRVQRRYDKEKGRNLSNVYWITLQNGSAEKPLKDRINNNHEGSANSAPVQILHEGSANSAPTPSANSAPKPINLEPINEPIHTQGEIENSHDDSEMRKIIDPYSIVHWQKPSLETFNALLVRSGKAKIITEPIYEDEYIRFRNYYENLEMTENKYFKTENIRQQKLMDWFHRRYKAEKNENSSNSNAKRNSDGKKLTFKQKQELERKQWEQDRMQSLRREAEKINDGDSGNGVF